MRAAVLHGPGDLRHTEVPEPALPAGGVVVDVQAAGVCAADRMLMTGVHPWGDLAYPFTPGHELLGTVRATDDPAWAVGDRVTAEVMLPCGRCRPCRAGRENLCRDGMHLGSGIPGAFAEQVALPAAACLHRVPDELALEVAVLAEPMACALHAVRRGQVHTGDVVAVVGVGAIGALALHAARSCGAGTVFAVTRPTAPNAAARAALARDLGADEPVADPDVVIQCSGSAAGLSAALDLVAPGGRVVLYGVYPATVAVDVNQIAELKELTVVGGHLAPGAFDDAIAPLGSLAGPVVTATRDLGDLAAALAPADRTGAPRLKEIVIP